MTDTTSLGFTYPEATDSANLWEHFQTLAENVNDWLVSHGRIATSTETSDSSTFTTAATSIGTVSAALVSGRTYKVRLVTHLGTTVAGDTANLGIREDSVSGTELQASVSVEIPTTTVAGHYFELETEYTAVATATKTFTAWAQRASGSGSLRREAASVRPQLFYVEYARG